METYAGNFENLKKACLDFLHNLPFYGLAVLCFEDPVVRELAAHFHKPLVSYGFGKDVDFRAHNIRQVGRDSMFEVTRYGKPAGEYQLALPGKHNVLNALAAIAIASRLGIADRIVARALRGFEGIARRFQYFGEVAVGEKVVDLVDDYAHHPTELSATIEAARQCWRDRRLVVVFQPHRYTRTRDLFDDFVRALSGVENLIITQVYAAGEKSIAGAGARSLCRSLRAVGGSPVFVESIDELDGALAKFLRDGDVLLTLGAGDIGRFASGLAMPANETLPEARAAGQ